jgi:hypothetical protein
MAGWDAAPTNPQYASFATKSRNRHSPARGAYPRDAGDWSFRFDI